ncbi:MAG: DUF1638 domain-containing protein [Phycisphaerae bacterium]|nr:DUF1638 domain-containing protein [Phycisphaerae bacterium]
MMQIVSPISCSSPKRYALIACEIVFREVCRLAADSRNIVDPIFMRKGLHDVDTKDMAAELQGKVDSVDASRYEAILLAYGRCNDGLAGVRAGAIPLVIPRAHDCITLFLGSKERYREYFDGHPGTYFRTSGWIERDFANEAGGVMRKLGLDRTREEYVAEYGQENADYIMQMIGGWEENYSRLAFIDTGVAEALAYAERTRREADEKGWAFDHVRGDLGLLGELLEGPWDPDRFVVVPPGQAIAVRNDELILESRGEEDLRGDP